MRLIYISKTDYTKTQGSDKKSDPPFKADLIENIDLQQFTETYSVLEEIKLALLPREYPLEPQRSNSG